MTTHVDYVESVDGAVCGKHAVSTSEPVLEN